MSRWLITILIGTSLFGADVEKVKNEPNLERRSELALELADNAVNAAKVAYDGHQAAGFTDSLRTVSEAVELSYESLEATGKPARKKPKYFKRAELKLRGLLRRLTTLEQDVSIEDREQVTLVRKRVNDLHEQILLDIMTKK